MQHLQHVRSQKDVGNLDSLPVGLCGHAGRVLLGINYRHQHHLHEGYKADR